MKGRWLYLSLTIMTKSSVIAVGPGPVVGLLSAFMLTERGGDVVILERNDKIVDSPLAVVYLPQP